jgi:hypothetical protein
MSSASAGRLRDALIVAMPYLDHKRDCRYRVERGHCTCGYRKVVGSIHNLANTNPPESQRRRPRLVTDEARLARAAGVKTNETTNREAHVRTALLNSAIL